MLFDAGEYVLLTEHNVPTKNGKESGNLILTNKRLALETSRMEKSGFFGKQRRDVIVFNVPLSNILIADKKKDFIFKKHEFSINAEGKIMEFTVNEPQLWINQIAAAKSGNVQNPNNTLGGTTQNIVIQQPGNSGTQQQSEIKQTQTEVVKIRCPQCKTLVDEQAKFCANCGFLVQ